MFEYLKGNIAEILLDKIVLEANGIGYRINSTINSTAQLTVDDNAIIYTYLVVREDEISLYGFVTKKELEMFQKLISVSKIGPKVAVGILSTYTPQRLAGYILSGDTASISKAPGVGKKTAERIILELKDKVDKEYVQYEPTLFNEENKDEIEVLEALMALGYTKVEGERAIKAVKDNNLSTEAMIKNALRWLTR